MEQLNRVLSTVALMATLLGSFALCATAYDRARSDGAHIAGFGLPVSQCRRVPDIDVGRFQLTTER